MFTALLCGSFIHANETPSYELGVSYLFWSVQEDQMSFAVDNLDMTQLGQAAKVKTHSPKWDSGVRLELDMHPHCCLVDYHLEWTHFGTRSNASAGNGETLSVGVTTVTGLSDAGDTPTLTARKAESRFDFSINEVGLDLGYPTLCASCFTFRPYVGIFGAIIHQNQKINYFGTEFKNLSDVFVTVSRRNHFWGVGPRLGIDLNWNFCRCLNLFTNANVASLFGQFDINNKFSAQPTVTFIANSIGRRLYRVRPMVDCMIGLEWMQPIKRCNLRWAIAYEFQYFWQQWNDFSNVLGTFVSGEGNWGDLALQGVVISCHLLF